MLWFRSTSDGATSAAKERDAKVHAAGTREVVREDGTRVRVPAKFTLDVDPDGPLRLEGQVVDADGKGVGSADVWVSASPERSTTTDGDGSFSFDGLVGKSYTVTASAGDAIGATVVMLKPSSDPAVVHIAPGATARVTVVDEDRKPIAGAKVSAPGYQRETTSDQAGKATLKPLHPGWVAVEANAPGYASATTYASIGSAGASADVTLVLHKGVAVAGRVLDDNGKPIAHAHVSTADDWADDDGVDTDADGKFSFAAIAHGVQVLMGVDGEQAPATSSPFMVGERPVTNIDIKMGAGGVLAGRVVDRDDKPIAFATVRIATSGKQRMRAVSRTATTGRDGTFELHGLPRHKLSARAETGDTASKLVEADLEGQAAVKDLKLVLDVSGTIRGVVVDGDGKAVPEVSVHAIPDVFGGASEEQLLVAELSSATTDGGGNFAIGGLPDGQYKLWASHGTRTRGGEDTGVSAKTGDAKVRIVLKANGTLVAKLAIDGQTTPPKLASVDLAGAAPTPVTDGAVSIGDLAPGSYDVSFRGAEFAAFVKHDVQIEAGKTTDLGTVTVNRGRRLSGVVLDASGTPAGNAKIKLGTMLFSAANEDDSNDSFDDVMGLRTTMSDQDGTFSVIGVPMKATNIIADHPDLGRSLGQPVAAGTDDLTGVTLQLRGYGSITGKVTSQGQPVGGVQVSDATAGGGPQATFVETASDGTFVMTKVPEGKHVLTAMQAQMMSMKASAATVDVVAGKPSTVVIDIPVGQLSLTVQIKPLPNNQVDAAQVFLFRGTGITFANGQQLLQSFFQSGLEGMKIWFGGASPMPVYDELVANDYTVCAIPITGNIADPKLQQRLQEDMENLKVYCKPVKVTPTPAAQSFVDELPAR